MTPSKISRNEITSIVSKILQQQNQVERSKILEMLLELDKDKTEARLEIERLKNELTSALHSLELRRNDQVSRKQHDCQENMRGRFSLLEGNIEKTRPNYLAILMILVTVMLPFLGWVYSLQISIWETRIEVASSKQELVEAKDKLKILNAKMDKK